MTRVDVDLTVDDFDASLLRNGVVSVRRLCVRNQQSASFSAFLVNARQCLSLSELELGMRLDAPEIEAFLDFALNKPITALSLPFNFTPAAMPTLTRLVSGRSLTTLDMWNGGDIPAQVLRPSPAFCAAVAAAPLVRLQYANAGLINTLTAGLSLLAAVTGHPTLRHLFLYDNRVAPAGCPAVGAALGLLVAADSPLVTLDISECALGNDGLLPFIDALARNTHLQRLECQGNNFTQFTAARLLAAVHANTSLISLKAARDEDATIPELVDAKTVVAARAT